MGSRLDPDQTRRFWDQQDWTKRFVGKRLCNNCVPKYAGRIIRGYNPKSETPRFFLVALFITAVLFFASIAGFGIASLLNSSPIVPTILFLACTIVFFGGAAGPWTIARLGCQAKKASPKLTVETAPLVGIGQLFNVANETT